MKYRLPVLLLVLLLVMPVQAQKKKNKHHADPLSGLYVTVDAGLLLANDKQADFYSGKPYYPNDLNRVLKSQQFGTEIWTRLVDQQLISPSAIHDYREFNVEEYAHMYYKLAYQLGVGFRYAYKSGWGWLLRFDFCQLAAAGQFMLSGSNGTGILGMDQYVPCDIFGLEKRILIDFAITKRIPLTETLDLEMGFGFNVNNTKVTENAIRVAGKSFSILDVWDGQYPYPGIGTYEYINQGGIGIGGLGSVALGYRIPLGSIDFGYTYYYMQTKFRHYNEADCYAPQHNIFIRLNMNDFSMFGRK